MADPVKGTGKKPKGSGRRLYTDENPKDTVSIKFATPADARATCAKVKRISKPYARKIQILTVVEQRSKAAGKREQARIAKRCKIALKKISAGCKAAAKRKFKVWPSAYASGWGVRCTRAGGPSRFGGGKKKK